MPPIVLSATVLKAVVARLTALGAHRSDNPLLHHVLVVRGEGRVVLAMTDMSSAVLYSHLPEPLPLTAFQRKVKAMQWEREGLCFLAPLAELREAARTARGTVTIAPGELFCGPLRLGRFATPDAADFPSILPALGSLAAGWTIREIHEGRVDIGALAAAKWE